jgi:NitT/TauT family transport system substrate-binding protein
MAPPSRSRFLTATAAAVAAAAPAARARAQTAAPLRVALIPSDFAGCAYYAQQLGYFSGAGLDVSLLPISNGSAIQAALVSGAIDIGYSNVVAVAAAHDRGVPFDFVCASGVQTPQNDISGLLVVASASSIRSARDLEGKSIAVSGINEIATLSVRDWMDANGGDSSKARFLELPFPAMADAVRSGRVDAASTTRALAPDAGTTGSALRLLVNTFNTVAPRWTTSAWIATPEWIAGHRPLLTTFVAAMRKTATWANAHHPESARILAAALSKTPGEIQAIQRVPYITHLTPELLQPSIDLAARYNVIKAPFRADEILDPAAR